jgi:uncharacterized protein YbjT (DUF2867 family)
MAREKVTVFGGTGFLGRRIVQHLLEGDFSVSVASRHQERAAALFPDVHIGIEWTHADINDDGSDTKSTSPYIRNRGEGERVVREAFPTATLIRPSVMFGRGDAFVSPIATMLRRLPVFPLFGGGQTRLQPAYVEDVAEAITRATRELHSGMCYELGGPQVYIYRSLLEVIAQSLGTKPLLVPVPFDLWHMFVLIAELFPHLPITRDQVELMQIDNVVSLD